MITGAAKWQPKVAPNDDVWQLRYRCPTCQQPAALNLQPPPWSAPTPDMLNDGGALNEDLRRKGPLKHEDVTVLETQVWCHRCGQGDTVRITE